MDNPSQSTSLPLPKDTGNIVHSQTTSTKNRETQEAKVLHENELIDKEDDFLVGVKLYTLLLALTFFVLMVALDASILATAIPRITDDFHTIANVGWYGSAYMIANSCLQPLAGKMYKFFPTKWTLFAFVGSFEIGSVLCAAAKSSTMLVLGRAVAGLGSSGLSSGCLILINTSAPPNQRPTILGIIMSVFALGQLIGPLVGGALTQHASWRWCFWINLPIGAASVLGTLAVRLPSQDAKPKITRSNFLQTFDLVGFTFFAPASIMLLLALQWGGINQPWSSATIIGLFIGSGITYIIFAIWEKRQGDDAMFPASLVGQKIIASSLIVSFLFFGAVIILGYYLPLWFQVVKHATPTGSAINILPSFISQIILAIISGPLSVKIGIFSPLAVCGAAVSSVGTGLMTTFTPTTSVGKWIGYQILSGVGRGLAIQQPINTVQASLKRAQLATGMSMVIWSQFFGGAIFIALGQTAFAAFLKQTLQEFAPNVDPTLIINAGATNYELLIPEADQADVLLAYNRALTKTYYLPTACAAVAAVVAIGMGWKRVVGGRTTTNMEGQANSQSSGDSRADDADIKVEEKSS